nr:FkbM family methyltransferase [Bacteroidota bacterium]
MNNNDLGDTLQTSAKTSFLNFFRNIFKIKFLENIIVTHTQQKPTDAFVAKIIPNNYQYEKPTWRTATRNGINYKLDISDYMEYCIYYGLQNEPRHILYDLAKQGQTIFDIGTNIGETLMNFARINSQGKNYGFEPVPHLYQRALQNISNNSFTNISLNNVALSDREEVLHFHQPTLKNSGSVYMIKGDISSADQKVQALSLDTFVNNNSIAKIDLIKIDTEGFEYNILSGGKESINKFHPVLFVEINDSNLHRQGNSAKALFELLISWDYKIYDAITNEQLTASYNFENKHFDIIARYN